MTINLLCSEKEFEDFCLDAFKSILHGEMFPYSLRGTYHLVFNSWDEAVNELQKNGVEGYSYQENSEDDDYFLSLHGFTQHVVMQDKTLELLACFCNTTYRQQMALFDIPVRFNTRCEKKGNGKIRVVQIPVNDFQSKCFVPSRDGHMTSCGDLYAKTCFDKFLQESGFSVNTATVAAAYGMPEEGLLCTLKQNDIIIDNDDDAGWELAEALKDSDLIIEKTDVDGMPEKQWTYKGLYFIWLLLTTNCSVRPCCDRNCCEE